MITKNKFAESTTSEYKILDKTDKDYEAFTCRYGCYGGQLVRLTKEQWEQIKNNKMLAMDVNDEYTICVIVE